jgi:hypothetical protein
MDRKILYLRPALAKIYKIGAALDASTESWCP